MASPVRLLVFGAAALLGALTLSQSLLRWSTLHNQTFDLAFYIRMAWGMVRGDSFLPIVGAHIWGLHLSPVVAVLGLLGSIFGGAQSLLVVQGLSVAATTWPMARLGPRRGGGQGALLAAAAWLLYPHMGHVASYEFHPGTLAVLPLAWTLDAVDRRAPRSMLLWALAVLLCREDLALITAALGALVAWREPVLRKAGLALLLISTLYLGLFLGVLHPRFAPERGSMVLHFGQWGSEAGGALLYVLAHPVEVLQHLLDPKRLGYLPKLLLPLALLPCLRPRWLLPALPIFAINLLSQFPTTTRLDSHYLTPALPFLMVAAAEGAQALQQRLRPQFVASILVLALATSHVVAGGSPLSMDHPSAAFSADERSRWGREILAQIPKQASVQAPDCLLPHLAERTGVYRSRGPDQQAAFLIVDQKDSKGLSGRGRKQLAEAGDFTLFGAPKQPKP